MIDRRCPACVAHVFAAPSKYLGAQAKGVEWRLLGRDGRLHWVGTDARDGKALCGEPFKW